MWVRKVGRAHLGNSHLVAVSCWQGWQWAVRAVENVLLIGLVGEAGVQVGYQLQVLVGHIFYMVAGVHQSEYPNRTRKKLHGRLRPGFRSSTVLYWSKQSQA